MVIIPTGKTFMVIPTPIARNHSETIHSVANEQTVETKPIHIGFMLVLFFIIGLIVFIILRPKHS